MKIEEALKLLNSKFIYKAETRRFGEVWQVLKGDGKWEGDCEDYSLTLVWLLSDQSWIKLLWNITTFKFLMWFVKAPSGEGHAVIKIGDLYYDNIQRRGVTKDALKKQG